MLMRVGHRSGQPTRPDPGPAVVWSDAAARMRARRRDRRGRGVRGPMAPRAVPLSRSRSDQFDEQVLVAWDRLAAGHPELEFIEVAVSDVPEPDEPHLAVFDPADAGLPARITVYRWALELRAGTTAGRNRLLKDVLAELAGAFLGRSAERIDPEYPRV